MDSDLELQPRFGEAGSDTFRKYVAALLPFDKMSRESLRGSDNRWAEYLEMTDAVGHALLDLDPAAIQYPIEEIDIAHLFPVAAEILNTRARIWSERSDLRRAALELCVALRLGKKVRESQGPLITWLCGVACEIRTLRSLKYVLSGFSGRDLKAEIWRDFPTAKNQRTELAETWRAEYIYIQAEAERMPLTEMVRDYVKIGRRMRVLDNSKESAWPIEEWIVNREETMEMTEQIIRTEIDWWENGQGAAPHYDHYWTGLPVPPDPGSDARRFRKVIADIENPLGKHIARRIAKGCWMGRVASRVRRRRLSLFRILYAVRSYSLGHLRQ